MCSLFIMVYTYIKQNRSVLDYKEIVLNCLSSMSYSEFVTSFTKQEHFSLFTGRRCQKLLLACYSQENY